MPDERQLLLRATWRLLRLFAVGMAWGVLFIPLCFANSSPGVAVHPSLARWLEPLLPLLVLLIPLSVVCGVLLITRLSRHAPRLSVGPVLLFAAIVGVPLLAGIAAAALESVGFALPGATVEGSWVSIALFAIGALPVLLAIVETVAAVLVGVVVSVVTLWRYRPWLAVAWLAAWVGLAVVVALGSVQNSSAGKDFGGGLLAVLAATGVFATALIAVIAVAGWRARAERSAGGVGSNLRGGAHRTSTST